MLDRFDGVGELGFGRARIRRAVKLAAYVEQDDVRAFLGEANGVRAALA
jgi:hypothetical protein